MKIEFKIEELPSGNYRVRKMHKGKKYTLYFDHKPSDKEVIQRLSERLDEQEQRINGSFEFYAHEYINKRGNVLSPSSESTYESKIRAISDKFKKKNIYDITQADVQTEINQYAKSHAPKSTKTLHGFISAVLGAYRPQLTLRTTLPQNEKKERYLPTESDFVAILCAAKGTEDSIGFQLGALSLRRAEICALEMSDLKGNELHVHSDVVFRKGTGWIKKETPKTDAGNRIVYLPDNLVEEINEKGYFFKYSPNKLLEHLHKYQKKLGIPQFRFHDLRHYFASYAHSLGIPDADIMALGGWKSDFVFKQIYRDSLKDKQKKSADKLNRSLFKQVQ